MAPANRNGPREPVLPADGGWADAAAAPRRPFLLMALAALVLVAAYAYLRSPGFRLQEIRVQGNRLVTHAAIAAAAGVEPGAVRWAHPPGAVRERLLGARLGLRDAAVAWLPGGVLAISVAEREPVALLPYYSAFALVDAEGYILAVGDLSAWPLPVVTGVPLRRGLVGGLVTGPGVEGALYAARVLPADVRAELGEIAVSPEGDLSLYFNGPITAVLGPPAELREKLLALVQVLPAARAQGMHIDLRNPRFPTLVPRQP